MPALSHARIRKPEQKRFSRSPRPISKGQRSIPHRAATKARLQARSTCNYEEWESSYTKGQKQRSLRRDIKNEESVRANRQRLIDALSLGTDAAAPAKVVQGQCEGGIL